MTTLVGRERELRQIEDGGALLVVGDPGIGKTALLEAAARRAEDSGLTVLRCAGAEFESGISFAALNQLLLGAGPEAEPALAVCLGLDTGPQPSIPDIAEAVLSVLRRAGPGLLVVDDLPWLDRMSGEVLAAVAGRLPGAGFRLLGAHRTGEATGLPFDRRLPLGALDDDASARLLDLRRPGLPYEARRRVLAEAHGNPLALTLLPAHGSTSSWTPLTSRLVETLRREVAALPASTQDLLLRVALGGTGDDAEPAQLEAAGVSLIHPLTRVAVIESSTAAARQRAHAVLAARHGADPVRRAWHLAEATVDPDEAVAAELEDAGRLLLGRGDVVGSVHLIGRAAELSGTETARADRLMHAAYVGMELGGRLEAARAVRVTGPAASLRAAITAAQLLYNEDGSALTAHRIVADALAANPGAPARDVEDALHTLMLACWSAARTDLWAAVDEQLPPDSPVLGVSVAVLKDPLATAAAAMPRLDALLDEPADPQRTLRLGKAAVYVDRIPRARAALERVVKDGRRGGAVSAAIHALISLTVEDWLTGAWDRADRNGAEIAEMSGRYGYTRYLAPARFLRTVVAANRGEAVGWSGTSDNGIGHLHAHHLDGLAALAQGDYQRAYAELSAIVPPGTLPWTSPHVMWVLLDVAEAAARSGHRAEARAHAAALNGTDVASISPRLALHVTAATAVAGDSDDLFDRALATPSADRYPFDLARVQLLYGERLRRNRHAVRARQQLAAAAETFRSLGARPWAARADAELRATGAHRRSPGATSIRLTGKEAEIAMLAATGLTNKEIAARLLVSPRTVGSHLHGAFRKLGISTRAALRDALSDTGH
ncbi:LuxR family transcriptional regulator [Paractinoplanes deccanensis]|uniref:LuxR family transcriptional regulator n=1 Tax=Paractinoplanes deccanensis TaxID=113561 RepID=A0ABQ3YJK0_9ACTN|nr:LuxR family transcriptional regulator [Actinoplanes deccanensis]GID80163.1 LuxR family transcriptional regulator [Actinoplanes deccanensis]